MSRGVSGVFCLKYLMTTDFSARDGGSFTVNELPEVAVINLMKQFCLAQRDRWDRGAKAVWLLCSQKNYQHCCTNVVQLTSLTRQSGMGWISLTTVLLPAIAGNSVRCAKATKQQWKYCINLAGEICFSLLETQSGVHRRQNSSGNTALSGLMDVVFHCWKETQSGVQRPKTKQKGSGSVALLELVTFVFHCWKPSQVCKFNNTEVEILHYLGWWDLLYIQWDTSNSSCHTIHPHYPFYSFFSFLKMLWLYSSAINTVLPFGSTAREKSKQKGFLVLD